LKAVVHRKFSGKESAVDDLLLKMSYELVYTPEAMDKTLFNIRDDEDYPILYTAVVEDVDVLITGDKDFAAIGLEKPEILTPAGFIAKYL
jgi:predicted nucleic acid-binding protein